MCRTERRSSSWSCCRFLQFFFLAFSEIGFGASVFKALTTQTIAAVLGGLGAFIFLLLFILDASYWKEFILGSVRFIFGLGAAGCLVLALILTFRSRPYAPLLGFFVVIAILCTLFFVYYYPRTHAINYLHSLSYAIMAVSLVSLGVALTFSAVNDFWWGAHTKREFRARLRVCAASYRCRSYGSFGRACDPRVR